MTARNNLSVLGRTHNLVVVLYNQELGQLVPAGHHFVRVGLGLAGEETGEFAGGKLGGLLFYFGLVGLKIVFQLGLGVL